jgi:peptidoglycan/LPS O-acetylase OafA/YrhL
MAVYFFFNLSGYLLSLSLAKEVRRRIYENKDSVGTQAGTEGRNLLPQVSLDFEDSGESQPSPTLKAKEGFLTSCFKGIQKSLLASILKKFLWNRIWKTFPMYFGAWCILKYFAHPNTHVEALDPKIKWSDIFGLRAFPGHLWTMRIDMIFYFYVTPVFICLLYVAFKLQKQGFAKASNAAFAAIVATLFATAIFNIVNEPTTLHPSTKKHNFAANMPSFCWGMIAGLINFALEQRFTKRQASKNARNAQEPAIEAQSEEGQDDSLAGKIKRIPKSICSFIMRNKYSIIFTAVLLRVISMNPASFSFFYPKEDTPKWQIANWHSYIYGIFILINDSRGGFWKFMHPNPEPASASLHPSFLHKAIYYFGLWSYAIYLTHVISYDLLAQYIQPKSTLTIEFWTISVLIAFAFGIVVDYVFDKLITDKIILGKIFPALGKVIKK